MGAHARTQAPSTYSIPLIKLEAGKLAEANAARAHFGPVPVAHARPHLDVLKQSAVAQLHMQRLNPAP